MKRIVNFLDFSVESFGFINCREFLSSTFHFETPGGVKILLFMSAFLGMLAHFFEKYIGVEPIVYVSFVYLLVAEFFTGVRVSVKVKGEKFQSKKAGRMILKIGAYTSIIGVLNIFSTRLPKPIIFGSEIDIYGALYYIVLNMIILQLIISYLENLSKLGYRENNKIVEFLMKKMEKWFEV